MIVRTPEPIRTLADLLERLGGISAQRVLFYPAPGTATELDLREVTQRQKGLFELVDGVLVEKAMGFRESCLAVALSAFLRAFVVPRNLGLVSGADGMVRLFPGLIRIPDVAFVSWERIPGGRMPDQPAPHLVPDQVVEILSEGNTPGEMARKLHEFFDSGVRLVWLVDPDARTVAVYTRAEQPALLNASQSLDGGDVLPGFSLRLLELFAELDRASHDPQE